MLKIQLVMNRESRIVCRDGKRHIEDSVGASAAPNVTVVPVAGWRPGRERARSRPGRERARSRAGPVAAREKIRRKSALAI